jgi:hypothetical protein
VTKFDDKLKTAQDQVSVRQSKLEADTATMLVNFEVAELSLAEYVRTFIERMKDHGFPGAIAPGQMRTGVRRRDKILRQVTPSIMGWIVTIKSHGLYDSSYKEESVFLDTNGTWWAYDYQTFPGRWGRKTDWSAPVWKQASLLRLAQGHKSWIQPLIEEALVTLALQLIASNAEVSSAVGTMASTLHAGDVSSD